MASKKKKKKDTSSMWWFWVSCGAAILPIFCRYMTSLSFDNPDFSAYDVKDAIFGCIGLSLGNFNLISYRNDSSQDYQQFKLKIIAYSLLFISCFCVFTGIIFAAEASGNLEKLSSLLYFFIYLFVMSSMVASYEANKNALKILNH